MPELPEVENVAEALRQNLLGKRLTGLKVRFKGVLSQSPRQTRAALLGKQLNEVHRHGKYMLLNFGADGATDIAHTSDTHLMIHLRMTGQIFILDDFQPDKHVHLTLDFEGLPVYYRDIRKFGRFTLVDDGRHPRAIAHVGPDMMQVKLRDWLPRISHRRAPIKALLLDQGIAAGLGNIYVDEALFRSRVHPGTPPAELERADLKRVFEASRSVMRLAIKHGGTTFLNFTNFHGQPGNFRRKLRVYQRTGQPCRDCGAQIERLVIAGRSSHFCPHCQPAG